MVSTQGGVRNETGTSDTPAGITTSTSRLPYHPVRCQHTREPTDAAQSDR